MSAYDPRFRFWLPAGVLILLAWNATLNAAILGGEESDQWIRLRSMTRDQREVLSRNLDRFDDLPREEKEAIKDLDARLAGLDPELRDRYMAVLRRYHTVFNSLPEDRRKEINKQTDPNEKLKLFLKFQEERRKATAAEDSKSADEVQGSSLAPRNIHQTAQELIVWFSLDQPADAKRKDELAAAKDPTKREALIKEISKNRKELGKKLHLEVEDFLTEKEKQEMERDFRPLDAKFRPNIERRVREFEKEEARQLENARKAEEKKKANGSDATTEESKKKAMDLTKSPEERKRIILQRAVKREREEHHDAWIKAHMKKLEQEALRHHDSLKVDPANLARFETVLPQWAWDSLDFMPPDAARRRLKVLYRLVFPPGSELPAPKPPAKSASEKAKPAPPPSGDAKPF